jgi:chloramphenicol-sensitive protein RarD
MPSAVAHRQGILFGIGAYSLWGLFPLYFRAIDAASPVEILAHRVVWSLVFVALLLLIMRRWAWIGRLRQAPSKVALLGLAAGVIAVNWGVYIWAVNSGNVVEASLGYFINPIVTVLLGVVLLRERLRPGQWAAVGLGFVAVVVLTFDYGRLPWIALVLACSFGTYGLIKKTVGLPGVESLAVETAVLFIPFLIYLFVLGGRGDLALTSGDTGLTLGLIAAGPITAIPLILFGAGAIRVPLSTMGLLQYITPVIQFLLGITVFGEAMPASRWIGFGLVWLALVVLTVEGYQSRRRRIRGEAVPTAEPI